MTQALLVIDAQQVYTTPGSPLYVQGWEKAVEKINSLVRAFEDQGLPIFYVRHTHKADGSDWGRMFDFAGLPPEPGFLEGTPFIKDAPGLLVSSSGISIYKHRYSAFMGTVLQELLEARGVNRIVITGFMTNFCCETTARHGHDLDYYVDFVMDATGCPDLGPTVTQEQIKQTVGASLGAGFARVMETKDFLGALALTA